MEGLLRGRAPSNTPLHELCEGLGYISIHGKLWEAVCERVVGWRVSGQPASCSRYELVKWNETLVPQPFYVFSGGIFVICALLQAFVFNDVLGSAAEVLKSSYCH